MLQYGILQTIVLPHLLWCNVFFIIDNVVISQYSCSPYLCLCQDCLQILRGGNLKTYIGKKFYRFYPLYLISVITLYFTSIPSHITFYTDINQVLLSIVGLATLTNHAPSTLWFMDLLLFFIIVTLLLFTLKKRKLLFVVILYGLLCCLFKLHYVDWRVVLYMPFYFIGLSISPDKYLGVCKKYGLLSLFFTVLVFIIPYRNVFITTLLNLLLIIVCGKITTFICKSQIHKSVIRTISFLSYSSMCAYFFHRQIYAIGIFLSLPLCIMPVVIFILAYTFQKTYDRILIKAKIKTLL